MKFKNNHVINKCFLIVAIILVHIFSTTAWADEDDGSIVSGDYAVAGAANLQSCTVGYNLLAGDVAFSKKLINGPLPYSIYYRGPIRNNLWTETELESQSQSTSGWTDNYQSYVNTISFSYTINNYKVSINNINTSYGAYLQSTLSGTTTATVNLYFVKLPGLGQVAVFKDEINNGNETLTRLYSTDPAGDVLKARYGGGGIDGLNWQTNLGEYTFVKSGGQMNISRYSSKYVFSTVAQQTSSQPGASFTSYAYIDSNGNWQTTELATFINTSSAYNYSENEVISSQTNLSSVTTSFQRVTSATFSNGTQLTFGYDSNNNLTQVNDNRNNTLTFQRNFHQNSGTSQTLNESRVVTSVTLVSGSDSQTANFNWQTYQVFEPGAGNTSISVFTMSSLSSPVGAYSFSYTMALNLSIPLYLRNYVTGYDSSIPDSSYTFPILSNATQNSSSGNGQNQSIQWNISTPQYSIVQDDQGFYVYSIETQTLESFIPGGGGVANEFDTTTTYDDAGNTIQMSFSPDGVNAQTTSIINDVSYGDYLNNPFPGNVPYFQTLVQGYPCLTNHGRPVTYIYTDPAHDLVQSLVDGNGNETTFNYDGFNRITQITEASGTPQQRQTTYTYTTLDDGSTPNTFSVPNSIAAPESNVTNTINARGQIVTQVRTSPQSGSDTKTSNYHYFEDPTQPNYGLLQFMSPPRESAGQIAEAIWYGYDNFGNVVVAQQNVRGVVRSTNYSGYTSAGLPTNVSYPDGSSDSIIYNAAYEVLSKTHTTTTGSATISNTYDSLLRLQTSTDADSQTTSYGYDNIGRKSQTTFPNGNIETYIYYPNGVLFAKKNYLPNWAEVASTWQVIDSNGRISYTRPGRENIQWTNISYDANGNVSQTQTAQGIINKWTYDSLNRVATHTDGNGFVDTKGFDDADNNTTETDANSNGSTRYFKNHDILQIERNSDFGEKDYFHDLDNNPIQINHLERQCTFGTFDAINRPQYTSCNANYSSGYGSLAVNDVYSYDQTGYGNLDSVVSQTGNGVNTTYQYDGFHRVTQKLQHSNTPQSWGYPASTLTNKYTYTSAGKLSSITYPSGNVVNYNYDSNGVLNNLILNNSQYLVSGISFDGANRLAGFSWGNGNVWQQWLDDAGRVQKVTNTWANSTTTTFIETYGYDNDGRMTSKVMNLSNNFSYGYDNDNQLTSEGFLGSSLQYIYDNNGNRLALRSSGNTGFPYASADYRYTGNHLSLWTKNGGGAQPLSVTNQGEVVTTYMGSAGYDAADKRRWEAGVPGSSTYTGQYFDYNQKGERTFRGGSWIDRQYAYDESSHLIGEYDASGNMVVEYIWMGDRPIVAVYPGNRIVYITTDYQGKPRQGMDAQTGQQVWYWNPDAFGVTQPQDGTTGLPNGVVINLRFPGQYYDVQSGLYYNLNRYYNPELGRYMEPDPTGLDAGLNPYSYAMNDPVNKEDSTGLQVVDIGCANNGRELLQFQPTVVGAPYLTIPQPAGWQTSTLNASTPNYHLYEYNFTISASGASVISALQAAIVNQPTPGVGSASPSGTAIDASPNDFTASFGEFARSSGAMFIGLFNVTSPVISYSVNNAEGSWVFNVTQAGHPLSDGYVLRGVLPTSDGGTTIINYGEGDSILQRLPVTSDFVNSVWYSVSQDNVNFAFPWGGNNITSSSDDAWPEAR